MTPVPRLPPYARVVEGGIEIRVKVVPGASRSEIVGALGHRLKIRVTAPAEGGKANRAVVKLVAAWLGVRDVEIVSGRSNREKTVRIVGITTIPFSARSRAELPSAARRSR